MSERLCSHCRAVRLVGPSREGDFCEACATGRTLADRDATIAQLREDIKEWRRLSDGFEAQRDSLVASLEATKPCEPCQRDDHDNCTGDCSSMCCALAAAERERDSALADLAALRAAKDDERFKLARSRAHTARVVAEEGDTYTLEGYNILVRALSKDLDYLLAILSPPEGP